MAEVASSSVKAEPAHIVTDSMSQTEPMPESATLQKTDSLNTAMTPQSGTTEVASSVTNGNNSNHNSRPANYPPRPPPKFDAATEERVRDLMSKARSVANGGDNAFKSEEDIYDLALLTNNLVQLMNAAYIATDTIVRGVSYMQGESRAHAKTAMFHARQDRREQKAANQVLNDATNQAPTHASPKDTTQAAANNARSTEVAASVGSNKENATADTADQQPNAATSQNKTNKKKGHWGNRRPYHKRKNGANHKTQENEADDQVGDAAETKENVGDKGVVKEHKPETSGSETATEATVADRSAAVAVKV